MLRPAWSAASSTYVRAFCNEACEPFWKFDAVGGVEELFVGRVEFDVEEFQDLFGKFLDVVDRELVELVPGRDADLVHKPRELRAFDRSGVGVQAIGWCSSRLVSVMAETSDYHREILAADQRGITRIINKAVWKNF